MNRNTCLVTCKGTTHRVVLAIASVSALHPAFAASRWLVTELANVSSGGARDNGSVGFYSTPVSLSADGRFVAFSSSGSSLASGDTNGVTDVFVRDRQTGQTTRVSVASGGSQANGPSRLPKISADGRFVVFLSEASNLV